MHAVSLTHTHSQPQYHSFAKDARLWKRDLKFYHFLFLGEMHSKGHYVGIVDFILSGDIIQPKY